MTAPGVAAAGAPPRGTAGYFMLNGVRVHVNKAGIIDSPGPLYGTYPAAATPTPPGVSATGAPPRGTAGSFILNGETVHVNAAGIIDSQGPYYGKYPSTVETRAAPAPVVDSGFDGPFKGSGPEAVQAPVSGPLDPTPQTALDALGLNGGQRNAYEAVRMIFTQYGLGTLAPVILGYIKQGFDGNTVGLMLQETPEYKLRFSGNDRRKAQGLGVLSPAEYLGLERSYEQIMRSNGLPPGFYDDPSDFANFIGLDVSPAEINDRVTSAVRFINDANPEAREALAAYYPELGVGDLAANFLDPSKARPVIERKVRAAEIGAAATRQGLSRTSVSAAESYGDLGVSADGARTAYSRIAGFLPGTAAIAARFGETYAQNDGEQELLGGLASARRKREQLYRSESDLFEGSAGASSRGLGRDNSGSY